MRTNVEFKTSDGTTLRGWHPFAPSLLPRIERLNPELNAVVVIDADRARAAATARVTNE